MFLTFANNNHICFIEMCFSAIFRRSFHFVFFALLVCYVLAIVFGCLHCNRSLVGSFVFVSISPPLPLSLSFSLSFPYTLTQSLSDTIHISNRYVRLNGTLCELFAEANKNREIVFRCFHSFHLSPYSFIYWYHWVDKIYSLSAFG